jgi:Porin PorA
MRRTFGYIAIVLGTVLIVLAPLLRWYSYPRVAKAPTDVNDYSNTIGTGSYFSPTQLAVVDGASIDNQSHAVGSPQESTDDVAVIRIVSKTFDTGTNAVLSYADDRYAMDRVSGYALHCCGEYPRHEGLTLKFPFDTQKRTYLFYDSTALKAFPARYVRDDEVAGLETYVFESDVPPTVIGAIGLPGKLAGQPGVPSVATTRYYTAETTVWVEPFTGAIIKAKQHHKEYLNDQAGTTVLNIADFTVQSSQADIEDTASQISTKYTQLKLVHDVLPLWGPILGLVLLAVGLLLLFRRRAGGSNVPEARPAPGTPAMEAGV